MICNHYFLVLRELFTNYVSTLGYLVGQPTANLVSRPNLVKVLKALVVKNSVLHDFGFGKVSPATQL